MVAAICKSEILSMAVRRSEVALRWIGVPVSPTALRWRGPEREGDKLSVFVTCERKWTDAARCTVPIDGASRSQAQLLDAVFDVASGVEGRFAQTPRRGVKARDHEEPVSLVSRPE